MNQKDKRKFTAAFKIKVALAAIKGKSTIAELGKCNELHPGQLMDRKRPYPGGRKNYFILKKETNTVSPDNAALYEQSGRLQHSFVIAFSCLKMGFTIPLPISHSKINSKDTRNHGCPCCFSGFAAFFISPAERLSLTPVYMSWLTKNSILLD